MFSTVANSAFAQSMVGQTINLPNSVKFYSQDGKTYRLQNPGNVILQPTVPGSRGGTFYPVTLGGKTFYLSAVSLNRVGFNTSADCRTLDAGSTSRNKSDLSIVNTSLAEYPISLRNIRSPSGGWSPSCKNYVSDNGQLGPWGVSFLQTAQGVKFAGPTSTFSAYDVLMQPQLWSLVCPRFSSFSKARKQHFIATFMATKSMDESGCNPNAINNAANVPNPPAVGQFQLEGSASLRNARSAQYCGGMYRSGTVQRTLPLGLEFSCAAYQTVTTQWNRSRPYCSAGGYWQEANRMGGDICQSMLSYPGCSGGSR